MKLLVTVGTTKFDDLISCVSDSQFLEFLYSLGYRDLVLQHGSSPLQLPTTTKLNINSFSYCKTLIPFIKESDAIISSGGSGTILEALDNNTDITVVINTTLQDNHQLELAKKLKESGYIRYTTVEGLQSMFATKHTLKKWIPSNNTIVVDLIQDMMR
jgi:beta-1,4-N-acetylglucosaminyltransferase